MCNINQSVYWFWGNNSLGKVLVAKPDRPEFNPEIHVVEGQMEEGETMGAGGRGL